MNDEVVLQLLIIGGAILDKRSKFDGFFFFFQGANAIATHYD